MVTDLGDNVLTFNTKFTVNDRVRETGDDDEATTAIPTAVTATKTRKQQNSSQVRLHH